MSNTSEMTWHYSGVQGDENYTVTCGDCEYNSQPPSNRCVNCRDGESFFPSNSCEYCSETMCGYRWDYPC
jgi:hypothetical protein